MDMYTAELFVYDELRDFLSASKLDSPIPYNFNGNPSIKDSIEAIGVPHPEVGLILVNGSSVGFDYQLEQDNQVKVYPISPHYHISSEVVLRDTPPSDFIVDVNLGKLAKLLRMAGFDTLYSNDYKDQDVANISATENRTVLTRDRRLLMQKIITHGYWLRSTDPREQLVEVLSRYGLCTRMKPFHRCLECNGIIRPVSKDQILERLEPNTKNYFNEFYECLECEKIYWKGSHYDHMSNFLAEISS